MTLALDPALGWLIVVPMVALFAAGAWHKARGFWHFEATLAAYQIVPRPLLRTAALAVLAVEALLVPGLLWPDFRPHAALVAAGLLLVYGAAMAVNLARGRRDVDCGCTGPADRRPIATWMVVRNAGFAAALVLAAGPWSGRALTATDALTVLAGCAALALLYHAADDLLARVAPRGRLLGGGA